MYEQQSKNLAIDLLSLANQSLYRTFAFGNATNLINT